MGSFTDGTEGSPAFPHLTTSIQPVMFLAWLLFSQIQLKLANSLNRHEETWKDVHAFAHAQAFLGNKAEKKCQMCISSSHCFAMNGSQSSVCRVFLQQQHNNRKIPSL